jgi:hypothetical protein
VNQTVEFLGKSIFVISLQDSGLDLAVTIESRLMNFIKSDIKVLFNLAESFNVWSVDI